MYSNFWYLCPIHLYLIFEKSSLKLFSKSSWTNLIYTSGLSSLGVPGVPGHTQILADQLTLFQPGGTDYAHLITTGTPGFSDLPTALYISIYLDGNCSFAKIIVSELTYRVFKRWQKEISSRGSWFLILAFIDLSWSIFPIPQELLSNHNLYWMKNQSRTSVIILRMYLLSR